MNVDDSERRRLREQLATGDVDAADNAMCLLLDEVRARAATLPPEHPLRRAMAL